MIGIGLTVLYWHGPLACVVHVCEEWEGAEAQGMLKMVALRPLPVVIVQNLSPRVWEKFTFCPRGSNSDMFVFQKIKNKYEFCL